MNWTVFVKNFIEMVASLIENFIRHSGDFSDNFLHPLTSILVGGYFVVVRCRPQVVDHTCRYLSKRRVAALFNRDGQGHFYLLIDFLHV